MAEENKEIEGVSEELNEAEKEENVAETQEEKKEETAPDEKESEEPSDDEKVNMEDPQEVSKALDKKGVDYNALSEEYAMTGTLSDKSMAELAKVGISADMVSAYIEGCKARAELERNELAECVGGRESMDEIINWAATNLKQEEIISLNAIRNRFELEAVLIGLKTRMEEKEGKTANYQKGDGDKTSIGGFRSQAEMFEAIKNPKYNKDEAYRADVQKKIAASREAGIDLGIY